MQTRTPLRTSRQAALDHPSETERRRCRRQPAAPSNPTPRSPEPEASESTTRTTKHTAARDQFCIPARRVSLATGPKRTHQSERPPPGESDCRSEHMPISCGSLSIADSSDAIVASGTSASSKARSVASNRLGRRRRAHRRQHGRRSAFSGTRSRPPVVVVWLRRHHGRDLARRSRREDVPPAPVALGAVERGVGGAEAGVQRRSRLGSGHADADARM